MPCNGPKLVEHALMHTWKYRVTACYIVGVRTNSIYQNTVSKVSKKNNDPR